MQVELACLGVFRELGDHIRFDVDGTSVLALRSALKTHLIQTDQVALAAVVERSVFAAGDELLRDDDVISTDRLAILPPVAGG